MIVPMKKVTLLCLEKDKEASLVCLRDLAVMQLSGDAVSANNSDIESQKAKLNSMRQICSILQTMPETKGLRASDRTPDEMMTRAAEILKQRSDLLKDLEKAERDVEILQPWGNFSRETLEEIRRNGISVELCTTPVALFEERMKSPSAENHFPEKATLTVISRTKTAVNYVLVSTDPVTESDGTFERADLPNANLTELKGKIAELETTLNRLSDEFQSFQPRLAELKQICESRTEQLEFSIAKDGMSKNGPVAYLCGYVPVTGLEALKQTALDKGWALLIEDPAEDDEQVPTLLKKPKFLSILDPLFDFIGISPGYRENDVTLFFLLFFPVFFGMLIGDAGYGILFITISLICKRIFRKKEKAQMPLNLFILLSVFSLIWGWLNGSWLGLPRTVLPGWMQGWNLLADPSQSEFARDLAENLKLTNADMTPEQLDAVYASLKDKFVQYFCFLLAALHLASARLFKFFDEIPQTWRAVGHVGWACLIVANFMMAVNLIVFKNTFPVWGYGLYAAGVILCFGTAKGQELLNLPLSLIGSFTDVLSYIRLFAVGLSGAYIAVNFNRMGVMLLDSLPDQLVILGFVLLILVALAGHILNIALGFLGVLVHAVRLNTLEFSNHTNMQWAGTRFQPFAKRTNNNQN